MVFASSDVDYKAIPVLTFLESRTGLKHCLLRRAYLNIANYLSRCVRESLSALCQYGKVVTMPP